MDIGANAAPTAEKHLRAAPRKLAEVCLGWCAGGGEQQANQVAGAAAAKVGACKLKWEEETLRVLEAWLKDNPTLNGSNNIVGGRSSSGSLGGPPDNMGKGGGRSRAKGKGPKPLTPLEKCSKAMSRVLRHEAGTTTCPISEEGWVKWEHMLGHPLMSSFDEQQALQALRGNDKERFVSKPDTEGVWWIAAWSGHTLDGVTGPAVLVDPRDVPKVLAHGSTGATVAPFNDRESCEVAGTYIFMTPMNTAESGERTSRRRSWSTLRRPSRQAADSRRRATRYGCVKIPSQY